MVDNPTCVTGQCGRQAYRPQGRSHHNNRALGDAGANTPLDTVAAPNLICCRATASAPHERFRLTESMFVRNMPCTLSGTRKGEAHASVGDRLLDFTLRESASAAAEPPNQVPQSGSDTRLTLVSRFLLTFNRSVRSGAPGDRLEQRMPRRSCGRDSHLAPWCHPPNQILYLSPQTQPQPLRHGSQHPPGATGGVLSDCQASCAVTT